MAENPPDNEAAEDLHGLVVLFSLNQKLLYNRSERGMVEGRGLPGLILTTSVALQAELASYDAEEFTVANIRVIG
jgi:hypothetical protein